VERKLEVLASLLNEVGPISCNSFNDRLSIQKKAYLLKVFGLDPGFSFTYYKRGPLSWELWKNALELTKITPKGISFNDNEAEKRFNEYKKFILPYACNPRMLELLASMQFWVAKNPELTKREIFQKLKDKLHDILDTPDFSDEECEEAWKYLSRWSEYTGVSC